MAFTLLRPPGSTPFADKEFPPVIISYGAVEKAGSTAIVYGRCPHLPIYINDLGFDENICRSFFEVFQQPLTRREKPPYQQSDNQKATSEEFRGFF
jgi:hypothetical protein